MVVSSVATATAAAALSIQMWTIFAMHAHITVVTLGSVCLSECACVQDKQMRVSVGVGLAVQHASLALMKYALY